MAGHPRNASDASSLQERAREILFRAWERGKNRVEFKQGADPPPGSRAVADRGNTT